MLPELVPDGRMRGLVHGEGVAAQRAAQRGHGNGARAAAAQVWRGAEPRARALAASATHTTLL